MNIALLTAAGSGTRMHSDVPKQFMHVNGKPLIVHTLEKFQRHPNIDAILVVTIESWIDVIWAYARDYGITKLKWIIPGGSTGQESICNGVRLLQKECSPEDVVMIHDGNRCEVSAEIISNSFAVYKEKGSAVAAIPCVEAVFVSDDGLTSNETIPRERLWRTQTPHTYQLSKLIWAHDQAAERGITGTAATCSLMQVLGESINFSLGSERNLKITTMDDLHIFTALLSVDEKRAN